MIVAVVDIAFDEGSAIVEVVSVRVVVVGISDVEVVIVAVGRHRTSVSGTVVFARSLQVIVKEFQHRHGGQQCSFTCQTPLTLTHW